MKKKSEVFALQCEIIKNEIATPSTTARNDKGGGESVDEVLRRK